MKETATKTGVREIISECDFTIGNRGLSAERNNALMNNKILLMRHNEECRIENGYTNGK
jgi:hypothetical protein